MMKLLSRRVPSALERRGCSGPARWSPQAPAPRRHAPRPHAPDEAEVHAQGAVYAGAVNAQEHPVSDAGPARVLRAAVEARLKQTQRTSELRRQLCRSSTPWCNTAPSLPVTPPPSLDFPVLQNPLPGHPIATGRPGLQPGLAPDQTQGNNPSREVAQRSSAATLFAGTARSRLKRV